MTIDLDALERIAQAATPGPWEWEPPSEDDWPSADQSLVTSRPGSDGYRDVVVAGWGYDASGTDASDEDRAHIAAFDPPTALALIARVRELEAIERERDRFQAALEELAALAKECPTVDTVDHFLTRALNDKEAEK